MTAATYDFNLSAVQSSASSMIVELQPDTTSATPGTDGRWQGGVRPRITLNWAATVKLAQGTVNTAPNSIVDGPADYVWAKISSTPSDLTLDVSALPRVRIIDDDTSGGGGGTAPAYGPKTTTDSGYVQTGTSTHRISGKLVDAETFTLWMGSNANGTDAVRWDYTGFNGWRLVLVTAGADNVIQTGGVDPTANPDFTYQQSNGRMVMTAAGATVFDRPLAGKAGTYARAQISAPGQPITIISLAS